MKKNIHDIIGVCVQSPGAPWLRRVGEAPEPAEGAQAAGDGGQVRKERGADHTQVDGESRKEGKEECSLS